MSSRRAAGHRGGDGRAQPTRFTPAPRRRRRARFAPRRRNGCARSATSPAPRAGSRRPARRIPATTIAAWNEFEDALARAERHIVPSAVTRAAGARGGEPGRAGVSDDLRARAEGERASWTAALAVYRQARAALAGGRGRCCTTSRSPRARRRTRRPAACRARRCATRRQRADEAALALDAEQRHGAQRPRPARGRRRPRRRRGEGVRARRPRSIRTTPRYWANLGNARRALGDRDRRRAGLPPGARRRRARGRRRQRPRRPAGRSEAARRGGAVVRARDRRRARSRRSAAEPRHRPAGERTDRLARPRRIGRCSPPAAKYKREREAAAKLLASLGARDEIASWLIG